MTKKHKKEQQQKDWGLSVNADVPIVLVHDNDEGVNRILEEIVDGVASLGIQLILVEPEVQEYSMKYRDWEGRYPGSIKMISKKDMLNDVFDIGLWDEVTEQDLEYLKEHQIVPLAEKGLVEPFDPILEKGNGFLFKEGDSWSLFASLVRAAETYRFPYDWNNIVKANR